MTAAGLELEGKPVRYTEEEFGSPGAHYDVVVRRRTSYAWRKDVIGTIERPAAREERGRNSVRDLYRYILIGGY